jgi:hypothetical protein
MSHWCTILVPSFLADFEIIPIPNLPNLTDPRIPSPNRGLRPLAPINLASNIGIGMISKSAKKDGTIIVHQCQNKRLLLSFGLCYQFPPFPK